MNYYFNIIKDIKKKRVIRLNISANFVPAKFLLGLSGRRGGIGSLKTRALNIHIPFFIFSIGITTLFVKKKPT